MQANNRLQAIRDTIRKLYTQNNPDKDKWADWLYEYHVLVVAEQARQLAAKYGANAEIAEVCALLHDIADAVTQRKDPEHEAKSLAIARDLLAKNSYSDDEITLIVEDALRFHSCHNGEQPASLEGKILSTADAYAHLKTDFYFHAIHMFKGIKTYRESKEWILAKLERDYNNKTLFEDEKNAWKRDYDIFKELFSR